MAWFVTINFYKYLYLSQHFYEFWFAEVYLGYNFLQNKNNIANSRQALLNFTNELFYFC